ncbi:MAG: hypothetical protein LUC93_13800, partial [Planctomycetaceae bacterium]|nr:hypothetical protein [Planctomycetaceae bacterium]
DLASLATDRILAVPALAVSINRVATNPDSGSLATGRAVPAGSTNRATADAAVLIAVGRAAIAVLVRAAAVTRHDPDRRQQHYQKLWWTRLLC